MADSGFRTAVSTGVGAIQKDGFDYFLLICVLALVGFGILFVFSTSYIQALKQLGDSAYYFKRQLGFAGLGILLLLGTAFLDYRWWGKLSGLILLGTAGLLVLVLIPGLGIRVGGSSRWLRLGWITFQPTELAKLAVVIFLARWLTAPGGGRKKEEPQVILPLLVAGGVAMLILWQPDFGSAVLVGVLALILLIGAGVGWNRIAFLAVGSLPLLTLLITSGSGYRLRRIFAFLNPWRDPEGSGFQIIQSFYAFAQGGIWGQGFGEGRQKLFFLPESHTDFILAVVGEELGFIGVAGVLVFFLILIHRGIQIALRAPDPFGRLLALGLVAMVGFQALLNMGVVLGLLPTKGLTLPFISYGGTSLVVNLIAVGLLISVSAHPSPGRKRGW